MTSAQIRQQFIDFFVQKHGHTFVPSSPVVPHDDPTLLFTNAGMNQFKPIFLGQEKRSYSRAVNTQKCIRAGGKHNDLDDVGRSRRHHTFFEMLGNWSFGDYFKQGAIEMAWDLLTKVWKLDPARLHVTCFEGDEKNGVPRDAEAANIWKKVANLPDDQIHYFGKDNFWEMGDTGPCGPCTEIYIDRTPDKSGGPQVNGTDPRVMEIWNLVFIQYNRAWKDDGEKRLHDFDSATAEPGPDESAENALTRIRIAKFGTKSRADMIGQTTTLDILPAQHVDTGMGLERLSQVLQGENDNYGTDLFTPLFDAITQLTGISYGGLFPPTNAADPVAEAANPQLRYDIAFRVIADHLRCLTFALTDGAVPSKDGRGYVLRRILRRAVRFGRQQLNLRDPFLFKLVEPVVQTMGAAFPELKVAPDKVVELVRDEELSFSRTIDRGIDLFEEAANRAYADDEKVLVVSAEDAFKLHDTYGFPIDLTRIMAEERGMRVDIEGYNELMRRAIIIAKGGDKGADTVLSQLSPAALASLVSKGVTATDDQPKYKGEPVTAMINAFWDGSNLVEQLAPGLEAAVILDRTNHYAEMGGQVGDAGSIAAKSGAMFGVSTTRVVGGYILHIGKAAGAMKVGDAVTVTVDAKRHKTQQSHTTTHVANWALREVLGEGVQQKGSLVDPDKLRFDFSHGKSMSDPEVERVEELVNTAIKQSMKVYTDIVPQERALKIHGLRAVFGEKYPPMVRVVSIGVPVKELIAEPANPKWQNYSIEFCGGTHLDSTGQAETFVIVAEESVSKGIRRLVALTGDAAARAQTLGKSVDLLIDEAAKLPDDKLPDVLAALQKSIASGDLALRAKRRAQAAVTHLQDRYRKFEKASKSQSQSSFDVGKASDDLLATATLLGGGKLVVTQVAEASQDQLLALTDSLRKKAGSYGILLASTADGKVSLVAAVSDDLIAKGLKAGDWIREAAKATGGGGGGRPQMAQAGGKDPAKLPDALQVARDFAAKVLA